MDNAKQLIQSSAKKNGLRASSSKIAKDAGFKSRKAINYYFGTRKNLFGSIGIEIKSPQEKLIEATKELAHRSSAREIAKKSGYKSHKIINLYFDSLEDLKRKSGKYKCNKEKISFKGVEFSLQDISRGVTIPEKINELVAEEAGWHAGDGSLYAKKKTGYLYCLAGDANQETDFYKDYVHKIFKRIYNLDIKLRKLSGGKTFGFVASSKAIYTYKNKCLGFPLGKKASIVEIPAQILESGNELIKGSFIRGLFDTDFSLSFQKKHKNRHYYPYIAGSLNSEKIIDQTASILKKMGFKPIKRVEIRKEKNKQYALKIIGYKQLEKWMDKISFRNPKHMTKYLVWKKFGFCPPHTTIQERKLILENKLDPNSFYEVAEGA
ncbi:MAG: LAGLIDADG family homing endonuclease [Candidatus Diapherotrites archaeon]